MNYLTNYYKNLCEKLEKEINLIQEQLHSSIDNPKKSDLGTLVGGKNKGMQPESTKPSEEVKPTYPKEEKGDELQEGSRGMRKALKHGKKYPHLISRAAESQHGKILTHIKSHEKDMESLGMRADDSEDTKSAASGYADLITGRVSSKESRETAKTLTAVNPINDDPDQPKTEGDYYYDKVGTKIPDRIDNMLTNLQNLQKLKLNTDRKKKKNKKK